MPDRSFNRHPLPPLALIVLASMLALVLGLFLLDTLEYAYRRIGIGEGAMFGLVLASLAGGVVNIPIARLDGEVSSGVKEVVAFGVRYRIPVRRRAAPTIVAVNLGGAVIPVAISVLLVVRDSLFWQPAVGVVFVAAIVHTVARAVPGLGIAVPGLLPPLLAAAISLAISPHLAAPLAYVSGSVGTLVGADLLNFGRLRSLGAGVVSVGGAGTFDGIFLSGIVAVLLVALA